jgi:hypothetical protein
MSLAARRAPSDAAPGRDRTPRPHPGQVRRPLAYRIVADDPPVAVVPRAQPRRPVRAQLDLRRDRRLHYVVEHVEQESSENERTCGGLSTMNPAAVVGHSRHGVLRTPICSNAGSAMRSARPRPPRRRGPSSATTPRSGFGKDPSRKPRETQSRTLASRPSGSQAIALSGCYLPKTLYACREDTRQA